MNALPKEQVQKLTPEAQEAFGHLLIDRTRHRAQLLETAKHSGGQTWWGILPWALSPLIFTLIFSSFRDQGAFSWPVIAGFAVLVGFLWVIDIANEIRANRIDRRLDALIELLEANGQLSEPVSDQAPANPKPAATPAPG